MLTFFHRPSSWDGGYYELMLGFDPNSQETLSYALRKLWSLPDLNGCYLSNTKRLGKQARLKIEAIDFHKTHLYGTAVLPNRKHVVCGSILIIDPDDIDWLVFFIPIESLGTAYSIGAYPFGGYENDSEWERPVDNWLAHIGQEIFSVAKYRFGVIGMEALNLIYAKKLLLDPTSHDNSMGALIPEDGKIHWHPPAYTDYIE